MAVRIRTRSKAAPQSADVGYGKPPVETRFQPGTSGNPRGRPKKSLLIDTILEKNLRKRVPVTRDGSRTTISIVDAVIEKLTLDAAKGDNAARKLVLQLNERRERSAAIIEQEKLKESPDELDADDREIYRQFRQEIFDEAAATLARQPSSIKRNKEK